MAGRLFQDPIDGDMASGQTCASQGLLLKADGSGNLTVVAAVTDTPVGVSVQESQRDYDQALLAAGRVSFYPSGGVIFCASVGGEALVTGTAIYVTQTAAADGHVSISSSNSAVRVGTYLGPALTTSANTAGLLIPVNTTMAGW